MPRKEILALAVALGLQTKVSNNGKRSHKPIKVLRNQVFDGLQSSSPTRKRRIDQKPKERRHHQVLRRTGKGAMDAARSILTPLPSDPAVDDSLADAELSEESGGLNDYDQQQHSGNVPTFGGFPTDTFSSTAPLQVRVLASLRPPILLSATT